MKYSQELRDDFKKEFKADHDIEFSDSEAEEALDNMAGLFLAYSKENIPSKK